MRALHSNLMGLPAAFTLQLLSLTGLCMFCVFTGNVRFVKVNVFSEFAAFLNVGMANRTTCKVKHAVCQVSSRLPNGMAILTDSPIPGTVEPMERAPKTL